MRRHVSTTLASSPGRTGICIQWNDHPTSRNRWSISVWRFWYRPVT